ncbi:MAG: integrase arm-type DNA-binding domain-containing protein [Gammaproteobacteria bacterium]|nr:integrase arm-type DNA-binding domain-containing protein [Gammaproteobacteria bacterium]
MPVIVKPLTNTEVKQAKPKDKVYALSDGDGLSIRVKPNDSKLWLFNYTTPYTKKRTSISFGIYPELSLANARKRRDEARKLLAKDIVPKENREEKKRINNIFHNNTLKHIAKKWLEIKKGTVTTDHAKDIWRSLELHIFPSLRKIPIHKITAIQTIEVIEPISAKGTFQFRVF